MKLRFASRPLTLTPSGLAWQSTMAAASGLLLVLSFPKFELSWLAWVALAPLLYVVASGVGLRRAFWLGWLAGVIFTFFSDNWVAHSMTNFGGLLTVVAYAVTFFFSAIIALFPGIFAAAVVQLRQAFGWWTLAFAPVLWVGSEWLRSIVTGVTWNALGISQAHHFAVARVAQYGGVYLVSWEVAAGSAMLVLLLKARGRETRVAAGLMVMTALAVMLLPPLPPQPNTQHLTVIGVQPNIPVNLPETAHDIARLVEQNFQLTRDALSRAPGKAADLVVWAESPLILNYEKDETLRARLDTFARETGSYFIFSAVARDGDRYFNSAQTLNPRPAAASAALRRYDKIRLVPFGEYVPWRSVLGRFMPTIVGEGFTPGTDPVVNLLKLETQRGALEQSDELGIPVPIIERTTNFVRVGTFICYEAAYPDLVRRFAQNGAALLVNISDDAWFGNTAGARQHLAHAVMRAIENNRDLVRVTNSGITALITADGRVVDALPEFTPAAQIWRAEARGGQTFYTRHGDWFAMGCALLSALAVAVSLARGAKSASRNADDRTQP